MNRLCLITSLTKEFFGNIELFICIILVQAALTVDSVILNDINSYFYLGSAAKTSLIVSSFALARLACDLPISFLTRKISNEVLLIMGTMFIAIGSLISAIAVNYYQLLIGRIMSGVGSSLTIILAVVLINKKSNIENRGSILAIYQASFLVGNCIGPIIGGITASLMNWRSSFWASFLISFVAFIFSILLIKKVNSEENDNIEKHKNLVSRKFSSTFYFYVSTVNFSTFILFFALESFNRVIIPLFGSERLGFSSIILGGIFSIIAIIRFFSSFFGGLISDKVGRSSVLITSFIIAGFGSISIIFSSTVSTFILVVIIFSIGRMGNNVNSTILGDITPPENLGLIIGLNRFIADLGLTIGPWVLGRIVDTWGFTLAGLTVGLSSWLVALAVYKVFGFAKNSKNSRNMELVYK